MGLTGLSPTPPNDVHKYLLSILLWKFGEQNGNARVVEITEADMIKVDSTRLESRYDAKARKTIFTLTVPGQVEAEVVDVARARVANLEL